MFIEERNGQPIIYRQLGDYCSHCLFHVAGTLGMQLVGMQNTHCTQALFVSSIVFYKHKNTNNMK